MEESSTTIASMRYLGLGMPTSLKYDAASNTQQLYENGGTADAGDMYTGLDRFGRLVETLSKTRATVQVDPLYGRNEDRAGGNVKVHYGWSPTDRWSLIRRKRTLTTPLDETLFLLKDYLDPAAIINSSGVVQERFAFDAFGPHRFLDPDFEPVGDAFAWNFLFHAEFRDQESGLYNYGFRYYHRDLGRCLSRDPVGERSGYNLYRIVGNNIVRGVDVVGLAVTLTPDGISVTTGVPCCDGRPYDVLEECCEGGIIVPPAIDDAGKKCCPSEMGEIRLEARDVFINGWRDTGHAWIETPTRSKGFYPTIPVPLIPADGVLDDDTATTPTHRRTFKACPQTITSVNNILEGYKGSVSGLDWTTYGGGITRIGPIPGNNRNCVTFICDNVLREAGLPYPLGVNTPGELVDTGFLDPVR